MKLKITTAVAGIAVAVAYFVLSASPSLGDSVGTINATVTVSAPCITIETTSVDFGSMPFQSKSIPAGGSLSLKTLADASSYTNCSGATEQVFERGTDAKSKSSTATWSLAATPVDPCLAGPDQYVLGIGPNAQYSTTTTNQLLASATPNVTEKLSVSIRMPCIGSSGAAEQMSFQYVLTAAF
jgi:hypothetical protein